MSAAVESFYDRWTPLYDVVASAPPVSGWRRDAVNRLRLRRGDVVVDAGCGTGANLPALRAAVGPTGTVVGVDVAGGALARARRRVRRAGWANVRVVRASATDLPVRADAVFGSFVAGMFDDPAAVVEGWRSALRPGGRIGLLDVRRGVHPLSPVVDPALRAFVGATTPTDTLRERARWTLAGDPLGRLTADVDAAHDRVARLSDGTTATRLGGYVRVTAGTVDGDAPA